MFEDEAYLAKYPETQEEIEIQEQFFAEEYCDNPRFLILGISKEDL